MSNLDEPFIKHLVLTNSQWHLIRDKIQEEYGKSTCIISWKLKDTLGFTVREHSIPKSADEWYIPPFTEIHLDFYSESMKTFFILKYMGTEPN